MHILFLYSLKWFLYMTKSTWQLMQSKGGKNVNYFFCSMARGCGTYLRKACAWSAPEIQISTSSVGFYTKKKALEETFLLLFFQVFHIFFCLSSAFSGHSQNLSFLNLFNKKITPTPGCSWGWCCRQKMFFPLLSCLCWTRTLGEYWHYFSKPLCNVDLVSLSPTLGTAVSDSYHPFCCE